jgi:hypothetical protein
MMLLGLLARRASAIRRIEAVRQLFYFLLFRDMHGAMKPARGLRLSQSKLRARRWFDGVTYPLREEMWRQIQSE